MLQVTLPPTTSVARSGFRPGAGRTRQWTPGRPLSVQVTLSALRRGAGDPTYRRGPDGAVWRATRTPDGPVLLRLREHPALAQVEATAWGPGTDWALDGVPELLGDRDRDHSFSPKPEHPALLGSLRARPGWRVMRTRAVFEALAGAALEQRVTGGEAHQSWRVLVLRYGERAPGPGGAPRGGPASGMAVPPSPADWLSIPSWEWLRAGVEQTRRRVIQAAAQVAGRLEETLALDDPAEIAGKLRTLPGVGVWTAAEVRQRAHGDPDAFSWADFHVARNVSWALTGRVLDDAGCAGVIECYRGHRYRVQRLLELAGASRPRVAPRMTLPTHLPTIV